MKQHLVKLYISIVLLENLKGPTSSVPVSKCSTQSYPCGKSDLFMFYLLVVMCNFCINHLYHDMIKS